MAIDKNGAPKNRHAYRDAVLSEHGPTTSSARLVALALTARMDAKTLESFAGAELLAKLTCLTERTVRTALHALKSEGWIEERTKGRGRDYALRIRRATFPAGLPAMIAATQSATAGNGCRYSGTRVAANGESSGGKKPLRVPAMVAAYPESEIPNKNPGAATPSPADAGFAAKNEAERRAAIWQALDTGKDEKAIAAELGETLSFVRGVATLWREDQVNREKARERRETEREAAVGRLLRAGKPPEEIAATLGEPLEYVLGRQRLRDLNPFRRAPQQ